MVVIDASMALAWLFERSKPEEADCAACLLSSMADVKTVVPTLWHTEIANALLMGERRHVVNEAQVIDYLTLLSYLPITTDDAAPASRRDQVMGLAREHKLTAYDATYLDLAFRNGAVLATFDVELAEAVCRAGGTVFSS
ncbi:putative PilT protein domain protein [Candidatus Glomeribacter gigasporarum BEG34]|uniref:PIN domain-containing protein n=2 Tax=cellular organisms TaxID=131567 RepID=A0A8H3ZUZ3_GIGMA|nr:type II toxin-antitoxin system VapC family toxin [Candidatus Glomeribacter gigasporarum]KAF0333039.1 PIN domain-containing protein [Gigaspora margarita]CCD30120.1 putative PilT protein domain protein [Candidatus Glomeribacter gigasporarum BEG34]